MEEMWGLRRLVAGYLSGLSLSNLQIRCSQNGLSLSKAWDKNLSVPVSSFVLNATSQLMIRLALKAKWSAVSPDGVSVEIYQIASERLCDGYLFSVYSLYSAGLRLAGMGQFCIDSDF